MTEAPARAAATARFAPLPPPCRTNVPPATVSPGAGSSGTRTMKSTLTEPTTITLPIATDCSLLATPSGRGLRRGGEHEHGPRRPRLGRVRVSCPMADCTAKRPGGSSGRSAV